MKYYSCCQIFKYTWDQVANGFWNRYPNPYSSHVLTEDTISQSMQNGRLHVKRLLTKTNHLPRWGERFVPGPRHVCIVEESIVDPRNKTVTTYTRNIGYTSVMTVEEKCVYRPSGDNSDWTECSREAWVNSSLYGFSYALQKFGVERFKNNVSKSFKGFSFVLGQLYPAVDSAAHTSSTTAAATSAAASSAEKLRNTAETAKKIAASVVATN